MDQKAVSSRGPRRWTRVQPAPASNGITASNGIASSPGTIGSGEHHFVVYDARVLRCSCGATILATDPAVLREPVDGCDVDSIAMHAAWCEELELGDFGVRALPAPTR